MINHVFYTKTPARNCRGFLLPENRAKSLKSEQNRGAE